MKFSVLLDILIELLSKRRVTASYLAEKYKLSPRTVYRYVTILSESVPVHIKRGRSGGIHLSDSYKLPVGFLTAQEYDATIEALSEAYAHSPEPRFLEAKRKLSAQEKTDTRELALSGESGDILIDETSLDLPHSEAEKLRLIGACIRSLNVLEIKYAENDKTLSRKIEPHVLVLQNNAWHLYAFCHLKRDFVMLRLGYILSVVKTEETFRKRPFERSDIPLLKTEKTINVRLEISKSALDRVTDWIGAENIRMKNGKYIADIIFPDDETFVSKIFEFGTGIKVLTPPSLKIRVANLAAEVAKLYS